MMNDTMNKNEMRKSMKRIFLFDNMLMIHIDTELWDYLCNFRFFSSNPSDKEIEAEFISGTGITKNKPQLWSEANSRFVSYIEELRQIYKQDEYFMKLKNLIIKGGKVENLALIIDGINELAIAIDNNYDEIKEKEVGIIAYIGSRLGEAREYLVVYSNPTLKDKLYVFILKENQQGSQELVSETTFESFQCLADLDERKAVNKAIAAGFKKLPQAALLSVPQMAEAKRLAEYI